ncbi:MAG: long-chain fatty acid--CoA ligase [Bacteroidetes bacterium]|nr:long-chain fatty acid--CoA ligase [Bacteroidota bacterium]
MNTSTAIDFECVFDILAYQQRKYPQTNALNSFSAGTWKGLSIQEVQKKSDLVSGWFIENQFTSGDCVAIVPKAGNTHWMIIDFACQQLGLITVPLHPTASPEEMKAIVAETQARICIAADAGLFFKIKLLLNEDSPLNQVYHLEGNQEGFFPALSAKSLAPNVASQVIDERNKITADHTLAILYTSGSSGTPKGAGLTHRNVVSNIKSILPLFPLHAGHRAMSFLPFSHIFERTSCYAYIAFGVNIYFSESRDRLTSDFHTVRPYFCTCVPKTLEKMFDYLQEQRLKKNSLRRMLISWAMRTGERYKDEKNARLLFRIELLLARWLVLNRWKSSLGGKIKYMVVGAAALRPAIARMFSAAGITTLSGYGMTEASPFIATNRPQPGMTKFGTVGLPIPGIEIKLDAVNEKGEGEILIKGPNVFSGYFKQPELTAAAFTTDGWFKTGDVGTFINHRFLVITDRKKDIFKTTAGIYIAPAPLENHFMSSAFIHQCVIAGFNRPFVCAVLVPHFVVLENWCRENGVHWTSPQYMIHNIKVISKMQDEVDRLNEKVESFKRIRKFILADAEWTVEAGELTTSFKVIRTNIMKKYQSEIDKIYQEAKK